MEISNDITSGSVSVLKSCRKKKLTLKTAVTIILSFQNLLLN